MTILVFLLELKESVLILKSTIFEQVHYISTCSLLNIAIVKKCENGQTKIRPKRWLNKISVDFFTFYNIWSCDSIPVLKIFHFIKYLIIFVI